jgi:phosphatidylinositol-3-phosphatase
MARLKRRVTAGAVTVVMVLMAATFGQVLVDTDAQGAVVRAALPPGSISNILVINLENESFSSTFGPSSPATYLNQTLVPKGALLDNYYATGHVSLDNYIAQISGQAPAPMTNSDCLSVVGGSLVGQYVNVSPGTDDPNNSNYPGQVDGNGCVYPAPTATTNGAPTIADQLDAVYPPNPVTHVASWREYAGDMGNDPTRDGGTPDLLGGTDCAHPTLGGTDNTESAEATDGYTTRHNPFMYFHSIIDNSAECNANVVPNGTVTVGTPSTFNATQLPDTFTGHLANDLSSIATTPRFGFITPNLCNDGHDGTCAGTNVEGGKTGGLVAADLWLKHWMPLILASQAYKSGQMLVNITFDEGGLTDTTACCNEQPGPNWAYPGFSPLLGTPPTTPGADPGGGRIGALLLNSKYIQPGTVDTTGSYNHYSALRSYEDLLGLTSGGADGLGHLGFAAASGLTPFGQDVFPSPVAPTVTTQPSGQTVNPGQIATFTAAASGTPTPTAQWQISYDGGTTWSNIMGNSTATSTTLSGIVYGTFENGWQVRAVFTNGSGSATTNPATLAVP